MLWQRASKSTYGAAPAQKAASNNSVRMYQRCSSEYVFARSTNAELKASDMLQCDEAHAYWGLQHAALLRGAQWSSLLSSVFKRHVPGAAGLRYVCSMACGRLQELQADLVALQELTALATGCLTGVDIVAGPLSQATPSAIQLIHARYSDVKQLEDGSQQATYCVNGLYRPEEFAQVAREWTRVTRDCIVLIQTVDHDRVNALASAICDLGWHAHVYERHATEGARCAVLLRGRVGAAAAIPQVTLRVGKASQATVFMNYQIRVPPAKPSKQYPPLPSGNGHDGGEYNGSCGRGSDDTLSFFDTRGPEHLRDLDSKKGHHSYHFQRAVDAKRSEPGGDPKWLPYAANDTNSDNVTVLVTKLRAGQTSDEGVCEMLDREQKDISAAGPHPPQGGNLNTCWLSSGIDPDAASRGGSADLQEGDERSDGKISKGTKKGKQEGGVACHGPTCTPSPSPSPSPLPSFLASLTLLHAPSRSPPCCAPSPSPSPSPSPIDPPSPHTRYVLALGPPPST